MRTLARADPIRLRLPSIAANAPDGEVCACELLAPLDRSQPTVSHDLRALTQAGLLQGQRGKYAWFPEWPPERLVVMCAALGG